LFSAELHGIEEHLDEEAEDEEVEIICAMTAMRAT
jgi:hypothetical protein